MNRTKRIWAAGGLTVLLGAATGTALVAVGLSGEARACGGLFCGGPPPNPFDPLPVAQTGENVVFAIDKDPAGGASTLEAHIQILYAGDAALFSWVVPVDAAPVLSVGTDRLFSALETATRPQFRNSFVVDGECLPEPVTSFPSASPGSGGATGGFSGAGGATGAANSGVTVTFQGVVGPYESAVISATDPTALKKWLTDNQYVVSDQASGLIDSYVREGKFFVALRLTNGAGIKAIQPIVLTFKGTEPCVPLRLTAIAANPDMPVKLWVLADSRAVPKNFLEMKIDAARIDWLSNGSNYDQLVKEAANEAEGNAFVAEYAGSSAIAKGVLWSPGQFDLTNLRAAQTPPAYVQALIGLGLGNDPQTLVLLEKYIPMPEAVKTMGITPAQFYANLSLYWSQYAFPPYDLVTLTSEISGKIIEPRRLGQKLIDDHSYLTRLNTFISPEEMNTDPLFILNKDLPEVPLLQTATFHYMCGARQFMRCNAPIRLDLPDGRMAWVRNGSQGTTCGNGSIDRSKLDTLPALETAWQREESGEGLAVIDNTAVIRAGLQANNTAFPAEQKVFPIPGQNPQSQADGGVIPVGPDLQGKGGSGGCACAIATPSPSLAASSLAGFLAVVGLALCGRGPRRRRPKSAATRTETVTSSVGR